jgi:hypothetical protein
VLGHQPWQGNGNDPAGHGGSGTNATAMFPICSYSDASQATRRVRVGGHARRHGKNNGDREHAAGVTRAADATGLARR